MKKTFLPLLFITCLMLGLSIYDVQYTDSPSGDSPHMGEIVEVTAVVTATNFSGDKYFLGDSEGGPWTGVYVYDYEHEVAIGDMVTLTAEVDEYYELTELKNVSAFSSDGTGTVPEPYLTTCADLSSLESLEGVLVRVEDVEIVRNDSTGVWFSDGTGEAKFGFNFDHSYSPSIGDELAYINGMVNFSWGNYVLEPRFDDDIDLPEAEVTTVYDIQYSEEGPSPLYEQTVTIHAICTANNYSGTNYFVSDPGFGPWHGVYVFDSDNEPEVGDYLTFTAEVDEYYDLTELKNVSAFSIDSSGAEIAAYDCDIPSASQESMEGVLVTLENVVVESLREYDWVITDGTNTMPVMYHFDYEYTPVVGDTFATISGMVFYSYEEYKLEPRSDDDIELLESVKEDRVVPTDIAIAAYPNPFNGACYIDAPRNSKISIVDNSGRVIETEILYNVWRPTNALESGIYFISVQHDNENYIEKVLYLK